MVFVSPSIVVILYVIFDAISFMINQYCILKLFHLTDVSACVCVHAGVCVCVCAAALAV